MSESNTDLKSIIISHKKSETFNSKYDFDIWFTLIVFAIVCYILIYNIVINYIKSHKSDYIRRI